MVRHNKGCPAKCNLYQQFSKVKKDFVGMFSHPDPTQPCALN